MHLCRTIQAAIKDEVNVKSYIMESLENFQQNRGFNYVLIIGLQVKKKTCPTFEIYL